MNGDFPMFTTIITYVEVKGGPLLTKSVVLVHIDDARVTHVLLKCCAKFWLIPMRFRGRTLSQVNQVAST